MRRVRPSAMASSAYPGRLENMKIEEAIDQCTCNSRADNDSGT